MRDTEDIKQYTYNDGSSTSWPEYLLHNAVVKNWTCADEFNCDFKVNPDGSLKDPNHERFLDPEGCAARWDNQDLVSSEIKDCANTSSPEEEGCYVEHIQLPVEGKDYEHPQLSLMLVLDMLDDRDTTGNYLDTIHLLGEVNWIYEGEEGCPLSPSAPSSAVPAGSIGGASLLAIICSWVLIFGQ